MKMVLAGESFRAFNVHLLIHFHVFLLHTVHGEALLQAWGYGRYQNLDKFFAFREHVF